MVKKISVLIAGVGGGSVGLEILKALRLSKLPYEIIGCDMMKHNIGFVKADKHYILPPANKDNYLSALKDICLQEKVDVLFPGSEPDLKTISLNRETIEDQGILVPINTRHIIDLCLNKKETFKALDQNGIKTPKTIAVDSIETISDIDFFPVVIKPYLDSGGSRNTFIAQDHEELLFFCHYVLKYGGKPLIQEYIGSYENEYTVGVLSGKDQKSISIVGIKRDILSALSSKITVRSMKKEGKTLVISSGISQGRIVIDEELNRQCLIIAKTLKSEGPINIQCRFVDGVVYPFEINPRFSGTTYLRALANVNEPDIYIRKYLLNEKDILVPQPKQGFVFRGLDECFIEEQIEVKRT